VIHHTSGGTGSEPGPRSSARFTFLTTGASNTLPFNQLTLANVLNYQQPINFGISSYELPQWLLTGFVQDNIHLRSDLTIDVGLRYDRQTLTDATGNFAPRIGFGWHLGAIRARRSRRLRHVLHADSKQCGRWLPCERA